MVRSKLHLALIATLVAAPLAHAAPAEMKEAPVAAAPSAKALGGAEFAIATRGPTLVALPAPSVIEARSLKSRRQDQVKHGQPFEIGYARDVPNPRIGLQKLGWQRLSDGRLATSFEVSSGNAVAMRTALSLKALGRVDASGVTFRFGTSVRALVREGAWVRLPGHEVRLTPRGMLVSNGTTRRGSCQRKSTSSGLWT